MARAQAIAQQLLGKVAIARLGECCVEPDFEYFVNAKLSQRARALAGALEAKGRRARLKEAARMRFEYRNTKWSADRLGRFARGGDNGLVPAMHAIEIAKRNRCAARIVRYGRGRA